MSRCNGCGKIDHAGGCDLVDFYQWQRHGCVAQIMQGEPTPPSPPSPLIDSNMPGVIEATPLSVQTQNLEVVPRGTVRRSTLGIKSKKTKAIDDPVVIKRREEIRVARVKRMEYARSCRKAVNV